jgi:hypothetical protein
MHGTDKIIKFDPGKIILGFLISLVSNFLNIRYAPLCSNLNAIQSRAFCHLNNDYPTIKFSLSDFKNDVQKIRDASELKLAL